MLFKSDKVPAHWDTWIYHHNNTYYLYYLTANEASWDGFGVATSKDGLHWKDYGQQMFPSEKMVFFLGTGMVWEAADSDLGKRFLCNYSEYRKDDKDMYQTILFASSDDLIHWEPYGDDHIFLIDRDLYRYYKGEGGRWDCIWPLDRKEGGYWGYWTASPKDRAGFGFGYSEDGLQWKALPPPVIEWGDKQPLDHLEVGAIMKHGDLYYLMVGDYVEKGMFMLTGPTPQGPFTPVGQNYQILKSKDFMHVYFARFAHIDGEVLVNHHALTGEKKYDNWVTYLSPLKRVEIDDRGVLRLRWWAGNNPLKSEKLSQIDAEACNRGLVVEGFISKGGSLTLFGPNRERITITLEADNTSRLLAVNSRAVTAADSTAPSSGDSVQAVVDRTLQLSDEISFRLLFRKGMLEFYLDDYHIHCYTMSNPTVDRIEASQARDITYYRWPVL